jgi:branched-chain amino acid aminotransferase
MAAFESQKAEEVLMISDEKGIFAVEKIRNKTFAKDRFAGFVSLWQAGLNSLSN